MKMLMRFFNNQHFSRLAAWRLFWTNAVNLPFVPGLYHFCVNYLNCLLLFSRQSSSETDVQNHLIVGDDLLIKNLKSFRFVQAFCARDNETCRQGFAHLL